MEKNDLLEDLELSIKKALEARTAELAGALFRLQGSANGWCDLADCGNCALAPHKCITELDDTVEQLIDEYHTKKAATAQLAYETDPFQHEPYNEDKGHTSHKVDENTQLVASRLHHQLGGGAVDFVAEKIHSLSPVKNPEKVRRWQQVKAALLTHVDETEPPPVDPQTDTDIVRG